MNSPSGQNLVGNPELQGTGSCPRGWVFVAPRAEITPVHRVSHHPGRGSALVIEGNGDKHAFGCWRGAADLKVGRWYRASVRTRVHGVSHPALTLFATVAQHFLALEHSAGEEMLLRQVFRHEKESDGNNVEFYFRASAGGRSEWYDPRVVEIPAPEHRTARVAAVHFGSTCARLDPADQRRRISDKLDQAGALKPDLVALPEFTPVVGVLDEACLDGCMAAAETVPDGATCRILAAAARKYRMHVVAGIIKRDGKHVFNTAVLFDRQGNLIGQYDKTHLTFVELAAGFSCGSEYPVFDLDFGRIALHICYDEWFPEVARYYAHRGASMLLLLVAGGKPITWRTRALDNGCYFVAASITPPSMIIDSSGAIIAETQGDGVIFADLNVDYRQVNVYGAPTLSYGMPGINPQMRHVLDDSLLHHLADAMQTGKRPL